uniref:Nonstructural protein 1 n=1 Tax=Tarsiger cyanurus ambidensovirus TaxID=2794449 RepID=A0A8A4XCH2_9VIRU|nr:MAG: nonstructural protein 1 [Tarsiger cyanurus ambidensovirus]
MDQPDSSSVAGSSEYGQGEQPAELDATNHPCVHFNGGSEFDGHPRLRYIKRFHPEAYQELDHLREEVVGRYVAGAMRQGFQPTKKYLSEVFVYKDDQQRARMLARLDDYAGGYPGRLLIWVCEGDHLHVVHDCPHSNGQCRCFFGKTEDFRRNVRRPMRRIKYITEMDELDWSYVFLYFVVSKRENNPEVWIGGRLQRLPNSDEIIRWQDLQRKSREILDRETQRDGYHRGREDGYHEDCGSSVQTSVHKTGQKRSAPEGDRTVGLSQPTPSKQGKLSKYQKIKSTVESLLGEYFVLPATHLRDVLVEHAEADSLYDPGNDKCYAKACDYVQRRIIKFKLSDFRRLYEGKHPVFYANNLDPYTYYHDIQTSLKFVVGLLKWQYGDDDDRIREFLVNVRDWFNLIGWNGNNKINAIAIIGPQNCGKSYFWDMFAALAFNTGHVGSINNKNNMFAFQDIYSRRFVLGNELNFDSSAYDDMKKLCEGAAFNIRVKYEGDKIFTRAPVCLIANEIMEICNDPIFKDVRLHTMRWTQCPMLRASDKKPYPLCIFNLFDMYNVTLE